MTLLSSLISTALVPNKQNTLVVAIDSSGYVDYLKVADFLDSIKNALLTAESYILHVWSADLQISNHCIFTKSNIHDLCNYKPLSGSGGNGVIVSKSYMDEYNIAPTTFIFFTDGYIPIDTKYPINNAIFVLSEPLNRNLPYGDIVHWY